MVDYGYGNNTGPIKLHKVTTDSVEFEIVNTSAYSDFEIVNSSRNCMF